MLILSKKFLKITLWRIILTLFAIYDFHLPFYCMYLRKIKFTTDFYFKTDENLYHQIMSGIGNI